MTKIKNKRYKCLFKLQYNILNLHVYDYWMIKKNCFASNVLEHTFYSAFSLRNQKLYQSDN